jgi:ubiquinone/menaquinone biosynthesis C-methylase UbiE
MLKKNTSKIETKVEIIAGDSTKMNFENEKFDGILLDRVEINLKFIY